MTCKFCVHICVYVDQPWSFPYLPPSPPSLLFLSLPLPPSPSFCSLWDRSGRYIHTHLIIHFLDLLWNNLLILLHTQREKIKLLYMIKKVHVGKLSQIKIWFWNTHVLCINHLIVMWSSCDRFLCADIPTLPEYYRIGYWTTCDSECKNTITIQTKPTN